MQNNQFFVKFFQVRLRTLRNLFLILGLLWLPLVSVYGSSNSAGAASIPTQQVANVTPQLTICTPIATKKGTPCVTPSPIKLPMKPFPTATNTNSQMFWSEQVAGASPKGGVDIRWQISNLFVPSTFKVYRSARQNGPYLLVNKQPLDDTANLIKPSATYNLNDPQGKPGYWYKIEMFENQRLVATPKPFQAQAKSLQTVTQKEAVSQPLGALVNTAPKSSTVTKLKFFVSEDGVYRITYSDLISAGLDLSNVTGSQVDISTFGKSIQVSTNTPGALNSNSYFEFFGFGNRSPYTENAAYYLTFDGKGPAIYPLSNANSASANSQVSPKILTSGPNTYYVVDHFEQDIYEIPTEKDPNHWAWDIVKNVSGAVSASDTFTLTNLPSNLDPSIQITISVSLIGIDLEGVNQHNAGMSLNGHTLIQNVTWVGNDPSVYNFTIPQSWLQNGTNSFTFQTNTPLDTNSAVPDLIALKYIDLSYIRNPVASNWIRGSFNPGTTTVVSGFSDSQVIGYDITDQTNPLRDAITAVQQQDNSYSVTLGQSQAGLPTRNRNRLYYLTGISLLHSTANGNGVIGLAPDSPTNLLSLSNKADYIIIAPSDFITQALTLASFHQTTYNQNTLVVNVADIYDLFGQGNSTPQAIKDFLSFAHNNWQTAPRWILLFGNGNYDYRDYYNDPILNGSLIGPNYIPVYYGFGRYPFGGVTDDWYVAGSDGITPYAAIGRLPAQSPAEATQAVNNIINYVNYIKTTTNTDWEHQAAFVADAYDGAGNPLPQPAYFATDSDSIAQFLTSINNNFAINKFYNAQTGDGVTAVNSNVSIINYLGHGNNNLWSSNDVLDSGMVSGFANGSQRPLSVQLTCNTGGFDAVNNALAWTMVDAPNGGSIASIAATTYTDEQPDVAMGENVYKQLMNPNTNLTLGEGMQGAITAIIGLGGEYVASAQFYILIGDPAIYIAK